MFFFSPQKLFSFWRYLNSCLDVLVMKKNGLIRRISLISKFMTSRPGKQTIVIRVLHNISRSKGNQTMKLVFIVCQVEGYRNILKLSFRPLALPHIKLFYEIKRGLELVSLHNFWRKIFFLIYSLDIFFHCLVVFTSWDIERYVLYLFINQVVTSRILKLTLSF